MKDGLADFLRHVDRLESQNSALLEALKYASNTIVSMRPTFSQVKDEGHAYHDEVLNMINAVIAEAEKTNG